MSGRLGNGKIFDFPSLYVGEGRMNKYPFIGGGRTMLEKSRDFLERWKLLKSMMDTALLNAFQLKRLHEFNAKSLHSRLIAVLKASSKTQWFKRRLIKWTQWKWRGRAGSSFIVPDPHR